jgi:hypothetical protein
MQLDTTSKAATGHRRWAMKIALLFLPSIIRAPAIGAEDVGWTGDHGAQVPFGARASF